ncbi:KTSC domain-containing protein [Patescibacteria group bacterium]|nr:KTSC domain-containing protein [Patescibacteria group bacterium]
MDREFVDSSMINSIGYDQSSGTVEVEFRSSGQVWQYYDVPESTYNDVRAAGSLGKAFNAMLKTHFREARVG